MYIKQKTGDVFVVNIEGYENDLSQHPAIINHPDLFEVVESDVPENFEKLIYQEE